MGNNPGSLTKTADMISKKTPCSPISYNKTGSSAPDRPGWVLLLPENNGDIQYLVGISGYHSTERDARDEAMRYARKEFARYTGVNVTELDEFVHETYGASSSILDSTVTGKTQTTQETSALVRRAKAKEWYFEKFHANCGETDLGVAWQYWVLAEVPGDEFEAVQAWKQKKDQAKKARLKSEQSGIKEEVKRFAASHKKALAEIDRLIARADPLSALTVLQGDWNRLYDEIKSLEKRGSRFSSGISQLRLLMEEIPSVVQRVRSPLVIDSGRNATVLIPAMGGDVIEVPVWVWYRQEGGVSPVSGIPLLLKREGESRPVSRGKSDPHGRVVFRIKKMEPGNYKIMIDPQGSYLASLNPALQKIMASVDTMFSAAVYKPDMPGAVRAAIHKLFSGPSFKPPPVSTLIIGDVRYQDTRLGSSFGKALNRIIKQELSHIQYVKKMERPGTRGVRNLAGISKTRGIGMDKRPLLSMSSPAVQARLDNAEASLEARYFLDEENINLELKLILAKTGEIAAYAAASINKALIPGDLHIVPPSTGTSLELLSPIKSEILLELTTHRGDGVTFAEGEKITFYLSSDQDAYLLILYNDAAGNVIQVYPNSLSGDGFHRAGEYMAIPYEGASFDFTISPPLGVEQVWAFAATVPFHRLRGDRLSNGLTVLKQNLEEVVADLRKQGLKGGIGYGEANVVITTVRE